MSNYFVTGLTGFIGSQFLENLLRRDGTIYALVRPQSSGKIDDLVYDLRIPEGKLIAVHGDLSQPGLGVSEEDIAVLKGNIGGFYHLGAIYDISADAESQRKTNVRGTEEAVKLAERLEAGCFHHVSSIAAAGFYEGTFTEAMFEEAVDVEKNPYFETKHVSEGVVRKQCPIPWRIYRPGIVVGHSKSGWINKVDGPYYFFPILDKVAEVIPRWVPLPMIPSSEFNLVPVDFIANAIDHIGHAEGLDGQCFHLTDPNPLSLGEVFNEFLKAAKGPTLSLEMPQERIKELLPMGLKAFGQDTQFLHRFIEQIMKNIDLPGELLLSAEMSAKYDCSNTLSALADSAIQVPSLKDYAPVLWSYWEHNLDPKLTKPRTIEDAVKGKVALITGGSEGIGKQAALNFGRAGATVIIAARTQEKLDAAVADLKSAGCDAHAYSCDLSNLEACDDLIENILKDFGRVDILVNNAGRSIRRSLNITHDRFHDFERVMQLNYFSAVRLTMGLLPSMVERQSGHIINISSIATMAQGSPRFASYVASKSALDAWTKSAACEYFGDNIKFTNIHMPLVRTAMIEATTSYKNVNVMSPEQAGELINEAAIDQKMEIKTTTGAIMRLLNMFTPELYNLLLGTTFQLTEDSAAAKGRKDQTAKAEQALAVLKELELDAKTLENIAKVLYGFHA